MQFFAAFIFKKTIQYFITSKLIYKYSNRFNLKIKYIINYNYIHNFDFESLIVEEKIKIAVYVAYIIIINRFLMK